MNPELHIARRKFLRIFSLGTAISLSHPWRATLLANPPAIAPDTDRLRIRPSQYPVLNDVGGSIRLNFNELTNAITINRVSETRFATLDSTCTHQGCQVGRFRVVNGNMQCPCHGSLYNIEGEVFPDQPAPDNLATYPHFYGGENDTLDIYIPGIRLDASIDPIMQDANGISIARLHCEVTPFSTYEVHFRATLDDLPQRIPFSLQPDGTFPLNQFSTETEIEETLYVAAPGTTGFYQVAIVLTDVN
jgi:Rieske Fe-S protein